MTLFLRPATLSWPTLALLAVAGLLAALGGNPSATPVQRLSWLGIGVVAQVALTGVYRVAAWARFGQRRLVVLAVIVLGGLSRSIVIALLAPNIGAGDPLDFTERIIVGTVTFTAWGLIFGAVVQAWSDYRVALRELLGRTDQALAEADQFTREWNTRLEGIPVNGRELARAAAELHNDIEHRLRPLSHRLWYGVTNRQAVHDFVRSLVTHRLPMGAIAVTMVILYTWNTTPHFGFVESFFIASVTTCGVVIALWGGQVVATRWPRIDLTARLLSLAMSAGVAILVDWWSSGWADGPGIVVVAVGLIAIILGIQIMAVSTRKRRESLRTLDTRVEELESQRAAVATDLHSRWQSRWTATALRLQEAAETGDLGAAQRALAAAQALVDSTHSTDTQYWGLNQIAEAWEGIAAVRIEVPPHVPANAQSTLSQLVEEAIANAVRHGHARTIDVLVTVTNSSIDIIVTDDGLGLQQGSRAGLGTSWLDAIAVWSLTDSEGGTRLTARLPIGP